MRALYGDDPGELGAAERRLGARIAFNDLIEAELDRLEKAAAGAQPPSSRHRGWVAIPSDSELTEEQEDFIDYWSPRRVLDDCKAKRRLLSWVSKARQAEHLTGSNESELNRLLLALVTG